MSTDPTSTPADLARRAYTQLLEVNDPVTVAVARLHGPCPEYVGPTRRDLPGTMTPWLDGLSQRQPGCAGCDPGSYAEDTAQWPCATIALLGRHHGIHVPDPWW